MKDYVKTVLDWLKTQSVWIKILFMMAAAALGCCIVFGSCSSLMKSTPSIQQNQIGAEGVVSKEKNVSRTTKWFYKPDTLVDSENP